MQISLENAARSSRLAAQALAWTSVRARGRQKEREIERERERKREKERERERKREQVKRERESYGDLQHAAGSGSAKLARR